MHWLVDRDNRETKLLKLECRPTSFFDFFFVKYLLLMDSRYLLVFTFSIHNIFYDNKGIQLNWP